MQTFSCMKILLCKNLSLSSHSPLEQLSEEESMLDEGEKTPEPLQQMPTSPPPSITTHSYTATSCVYPSPGPLSKRRSGRSEDITRLSIGNRPEFYTDITVSPPTPGEWRRSLHACHVYMEPCRVYMELLQF